MSYKKVKKRLVYIGKISYIYFVNEIKLKRYDTVRNLVRQGK